MKTTPRALAALIMVLAWGLSLAWLGLRRSGRSESDFLRSQASLELAESEAWFRVMAGGTQLGTAGVTLDTIDSGYRIREALTVHLPTPTSILRTIRITVYYFTPSLALDSVISRYTSPNHREEFRIIQAGNEWRTGWSVDGGVPVLGSIRRETTSQLGTSLIPLSALPFRLALIGALAVGDDRNFPVLDGWPGSASRVDVHIGGDSTIVVSDSSVIDEISGEWRPARLDTIETRSLSLTTMDGGILLRVDSRGALVTLETPLGVRWEREDFNIARFNFRNRLDTTGSELRQALPVMLQLSGSRLSSDTTLTRTNWEVRRGDGSEVPPALKVASGIARKRFRQAGDLEVARWSMQSALNSPVDPLIQEGDSSITALWEELGADNSVEAISLAVASRVAVDTAINAASDALTTLESGRGRPEGIARLLAAVLSRAGYRARVAIGVMPDSDTLYSHAWVEVAERTNGRWTGVDPVSGRTVSTRLIELTATGSSHPQMLLPIASDVKFTQFPPPAPRRSDP